MPETPLVINSRNIFIGGGFFGDPRRLKKVSGV
jgi:hypothetical protein